MGSKPVKYVCNLTVKKSVTCVILMHFVSKYPNSFFILNYIYECIKKLNPMFLCISFQKDYPYRWSQVCGEIPYCCRECS